MLAAEDVIVGDVDEVWCVLKVSCRRHLGRKVRVYVLQLLGTYQRVAVDFNELQRMFSIEDV